MRMLRPGLRMLNTSVVGKKWLPSTRQERERDRDLRRSSQQPWRAWYHLAIWNHPSEGLRARQLEQKPICEACGRAPATVAHHKRQHSGSWELFVDPNNLESVCKPCHDGAIQRGERAGNYTNEIDLNQDVSIASNVLFPKTLARSAIPIAVVSGAPGSGKSHYVARHKRPGEIVINIDVIVAELAGTPIRSNETKKFYLQPAMIERNRRLNALARERQAARAWFIIGAPNAGERGRWATALGAEVIVIETPADECMARIYRDPNRVPIADELAQAAIEWWGRYTRSPGDTIVCGAS
jgi:predicted kinase/5-methylcytosine-specific restriction endonuclease McrA